MKSNHFDTLNNSSPNSIRFNPNPEELETLRAKIFSRTARFGKKTHINRVPVCEAEGADQTDALVLSSGEPVADDDRPSDRIHSTFEDLGRR